MSKRLQFYGYDSAGKRRIFSFKVANKADAIRGLERFNIQAGWFKPDSKKLNSEKIENRKYIKAQDRPETFFDRLDKFLAL